ADGCRIFGISRLERQLVEPLGIAIENRVLIVLGNLIAFEQLFDVVLAARVGDFVWKIRRVDKRLVADDLDRERHGQLFGLAADEYLPLFDLAGDVLLWVFLLPHAENALRD